MASARRKRDQQEENVRLAASFPSPGMPLLWKPIQFPAWHSRLIISNAPGGWRAISTLAASYPPKCHPLVNTWRKVAKHILYPCVRICVRLGRAPFAPQAKYIKSMTYIAERLSETMVLGEPIGTSTY